MEHEINENKLMRVVKKAGKDIATPALILWELLKSPATPLWAKAAIVATLTYLISPIDAIPDIFFPVGFTDDAAALAALIGTLATHIDDKIKARAKAANDRIFGN